MPVAQAIPRRIVEDKEREFFFIRGFNVAESQKAYSKTTIGEGIPA
jgi:hypothetical protein